MVAWMVGVARGDLTQAYAATSDAFRLRVNAEQFEALVRDNGLMNLERVEWTVNQSRSTVRTFGQYRSLVKCYGTLFVKDGRKLMATAEVLSVKSTDQLDRLDIDAL